MIATIIAWITKGGIKTITSEINRAYINKLNAKNNTQRINAEKEIKLLEAKKEIIIKEQGNYLTRWIRPAFAIPFIAYNTKIVVWDKMLGWGTTSDLSPEFWKLQMIVFGAYFLTRPIEKIVK